MLSIEITNVCNYKCFFCKARNVETPIILTDEIFYELIDDAVKAGIRTIRLTPSEGDIFTDTSILNKLMYLEKSEITSFYFHTNFSLVIPKIQDELLKFKKMRIHISNYGNGDKKLFTYLTRMKESMFYKVQKNIEYANKIGLPLIIESRDLNYEWSYDLTNDLTIEPLYRIASNWQESLEQNIKKGICSHLYIPRILSNGDMILCTCASDQGKGLPDSMIIGNIYKSSFDDLYFHYKRRQIIEDQKTLQYCDFCKGCDAFDTTTFIPSFQGWKNLARLKKE